jgi:hypothetical protein
MEINWDGPLLSFNPKKGTDLQGNPPGGIRFPTYGEYGGPQITGDGKPPVDSLDRFFAEHDQAIFDAMGKDSVEGPIISPLELVVAHENLIAKISALPETPDGLLKVVTDEGKTIADPEATLYAGFTALALSAQIASFGDQAFVMYQAEFAKDGLKLQDVLTDAVRYMKTGLDEVPSEGRGLNGLVQVFENQLTDYDFV